MAAPVAAARFAVPLGHAFPFFAVGADSVAGVDFALDSRSDRAVNNWNDITAIAFGTEQGTPRTFPLLWFLAHAQSASGAKPWTSLRGFSALLLRLRRAVWPSRPPARG